MANNHRTSMMPLSLTLLALFAGASIAKENDLPAFPPAEDPKLSGHHFRITAVEYAGYIVLEEDDNGGLSFSGYLIDILEELSLRANFSYDLLTPSGYGSRCDSRLSFPNTTMQTTSGPYQVHHHEAYHKRYRQGYLCGESDVNDRPITEYSTDMYWGSYYITPERLKIQKFTIPYSPPGSSASLGMLGHATHIQSIDDLTGTDYAVCAYKGTAYMDNLVLSFPQLQFNGVSYEDDVYTLLSDGSCDVIIDSYPMLQRMVLDLSKEGKCLANGKPIGVIGEPLQYGLNYFAFGIRMDLPDNVVQTLNFWMQALMACFPEDPNGYCPGGLGSFSRLYEGRGGRGDECGYVQFPTQETKRLLPVIAIVGIVIAPVVFFIALGMIWHMRQLKEQEKRIKKRFIQQLARNIDIGPSARQIPSQKLAEEFEHIGGQDNVISKQDLAKWMNDLNLDFLSERDFDRLWDTMDIHGSGLVDPIEFYHFLSECEKQFQEVHSELSALPKSEKVKIASRRLTNISAMGAEEVANMERRNNRRSRFIQLSPAAQRDVDGSTEAFSDTSQHTSMSMRLKDGSSRLASKLGFRS